MGNQHVQFRDQVVLSDGHEARALLWVKQDERAIRCGLAVPGADLHYSGYEAGSGRPHLTGKAKEGIELPAVAALGPLQLSPAPSSTQLLCSYTFTDIDDDWPKFELFEYGRATNVLFLQRSIVSPYFTIVVQVSDMRNFYPSQADAGIGTPCSILLDVSAEPLIALSVHDHGDQ